MPPSFQPQRWLDGLAKPRVVTRVALLATLLSASSLWGGRALDDWVLAVVARGDGAALGFSSGTWDCFAFTSGDPARNARLMSRGLLLPWWSEPGLKLSFLRPLSAWTHVLDELVWPQSSWAMHAHSLFWFAALLGSVGLVYRRLVRRATLSGLAFAIYALDDAHGATLSWLSNRNALISATLGCLALWGHDAGRTEGRKGARAFSLLCFALSWAAGEMAIGSLAYLVAYAFVRDPAPLRERASSIAPYALMCLAWRGIWSLSGYGARGSDAYVDPVAAPGKFLATAPRRWLGLLQGQLGVVPADFGFLSPPEQQWLWLLLGLLTSVAAARFIGPHVVDRDSRFWLSGSVLALLPMAASFPSDRLLLFVGLGVAPLLARALVGTVDDHCAGRARPLSKWLAVAFFCVHLVLAPLLLPLRADQMRRVARGARDARDGLLQNMPRPGQILIALNSPSLLLTSYLQVELNAQHSPMLSRFYVLSATDSAVRVQRTGEREVTLLAERGLLRSPLERHYRSASAPLGRGSRVELPGLRVEILASMPDARPTVVRFTLLRPVEGYAFRCWLHGRFQRCELPERGAVLELPSEDLGRVLFGRTSTT